MRLEDAFNSGCVGWKALGNGREEWTRLGE